MLGPPTAFIVSLVGAIKDTRRSPAIAGLVISALCGLLLLGGALLSILCR